MNAAEQPPAIVRWTLRLESATALDGPVKTLQPVVERLLAGGNRGAVLRGDRGVANWMINGRLVARTAAGERYDHRFDAPGRYEITAFNDAGRYDRISVSVR